MKDIYIELKNITQSGVWGTIGPYMMKAGEDIAEYAKSKYALALISDSAAFEVLLRSLEISYGDNVICANASYFNEAMTIAAVGATPIFCGDGKYIDISKAESAIESGNVKAAVVCDYNIDIISPICIKNNIPIIENAGYNLKLTKKEGIYASFCNLAPVCGSCGAVITNDYKAYCLAFSYHHCGHPVGEGAGIYNQALLGGDFRITEWEAAVISHYVNNGDFDSIKISPVLVNNSEMEIFS